MNKPIRTIKQANAIQQEEINKGFTHAQFIKITKSIPQLGLKKGTILKVSDYDVVTNEYIINPLNGVGSNMRLKKDLNCKALYFFIIT